MNVLCSRDVGLFTTAAETPNLGTLSRTLACQRHSCQAVYRLPTALSLILLTRPVDSSEADSEPWTAVSRENPHRYQSLGQFVCSNTWRGPDRPMTVTYSPDGLAAPTFLPLGFAYSRYSHALVGAEHTPSLWHERARSSSDATIRIHPHLSENALSTCLWRRIGWKPCLSIRSHQGPRRPPLPHELEASISRPGIKGRAVPRETRCGTCIIKTFLNFSFRPGSSGSFSQLSIILAHFNLQRRSLFPRQTTHNQT